MSNVTKDQLLAVLQNHVGAEKGISSDALAARLSTNTRVVRDLVTELRMDGIAVCGHPSNGYFIAATRDELEHTCKFLRSRAMSSLMLEAKLRGLPLADLVGQMKLPT